MNNSEHLRGPFFRKAKFLILGLGFAGFLFISNMARSHQISIEMQPITVAPLSTMSNVIVKLYETTGASLNSLVEFPEPFKLIGRYCGQKNAFYSFPTHSITLCYELVDDIFSRASLELMPKATLDHVGNHIAGAILFVVFHEMGHGLVHEFNIPTLGREEDVADQIASYIIIRSVVDQKDDSIIGGAWWFFNNGPMFYTAKHFADVHAMNAQRQFNIVCWAYGSNPKRYTSLASATGLPKTRATNCAAEYFQLSAAMNQLVVPHLKLKHTTSGLVNAPEEAPVPSGSETKKSKLAECTAKMMGMEKEAGLKLRAACMRE